MIYFKHEMQFRLIINLLTNLPINQFGLSENASEYFWKLSKLDCEPSRTS